jgi:hypothetical protein
MNDIDQCRVRACTRTTVSVPTLVHSRRQKSWTHSTAVQHPDADDAYNGEGQNTPRIRPVDITPRTWSHSVVSSAV